MNEEFVLPEVFYIHSTNLKESKTVANWYNSKHKINRFNHSLEGEYFHPNRDKVGVYGQITKPPGYTIVSFQEFKMYVLNSKPIVEDYHYLTSILKKYNIK